MTRKTPTEARMSVAASAEPAQAVDQAVDQAPAAKPYPLPVDEFHGLGGSYEMVDGVRRRVQGPPLDR